MRLAIEPLSALPPALVIEHLQRYGLAPAIVEWKYFDRAFGAGRERGYVWVRDGRVVGMIGLIPFKVAGTAGRVDCAWTCDWCVEAAKQNPGVGVLLLKGAIERSGLLATLGGNELTSALVPRLATHVNPAAADEVALALRAGGTRLFGAVERRLAVPGLLRVGAMPMPTLRRRPPARDVTVTVSPGVHRAVGAFVEETAADAANTVTPAYGMDYLEWQLERCPAIESASAYVSEGSRVQAAAAFWHPRNDVRQWRVALWMRDGQAMAAAVVLNDAARHIKLRGGHKVSAIAGRGDETGSVFADAGFRPVGRSYPFYVLAKDQANGLAGFSRLGYLDSDLGHRF